MATTTLRTPSRQNLIDLNRQTVDGTGEVVRSNDLDDVANLDNTIFDYGIADPNDHIQLGLAFAWCLVNQHVFFDGNKSTATLAFEWIIANNGHALTVPRDNPGLIASINDLYDTAASDIMNHVALIAAFVV